MIFLCVYGSQGVPKEETVALEYKSKVGDVLTYAYAMRAALTVAGKEGTETTVVQGEGTHNLITTKVRDGTMTIRIVESDEMQRESPEDINVWKRFYIGEFTLRPDGGIGRQSTSGIQTFPLPVFPKKALRVGDDWRVASKDLAGEIATTWKLAGFETVMKQPCVKLQGEVTGSMLVDGLPYKVEMGKLISFFDWQNGMIVSEACETVMQGTSEPKQKFILQYSLQLEKQEILEQEQLVETAVVLDLIQAGQRALTIGEHARAKSLFEHILREHPDLRWRKELEGLLKRADRGSN